LLEIVYLATDVFGILMDIFMNDYNNNPLPIIDKNSKWRWNQKSGKKRLESQKGLGKIL
jgi:hypothetical protein